MEQLAQIIQSVGVGKITTAIVIFTLLCFEISPIRINPISWFFKQIGKMLNKEVVDKVDNLQGQVNNLYNKVENNTSQLQNNIEQIQYDNARRSATNYRSLILQFGDELRRDIRHSKENFDQIISYIDGYEKYCKAHPEFENNRTQLTTKEILERYKQCMDEDNFL